MKRPRPALLLAALLCLPGYALAAAGPVVTTIQAPNWYSVELIVFRYTDPQAGSLETWPANPGAPDWQSAQPLSASAAAGAPSLTTSYRLSGDWRRLERSSSYTPLLHLAWVQPAIDRASAAYVRIGEPPATLPAAATAAPAATANAGTPVYGIARLSTTGIYLHFDLDLVYCGSPAQHLIAPASTAVAAATAAPACQPYRLRQGRKIDAGKLNYFDHPMFGALVLITPVAK